MDRDAPIIFLAISGLPLAYTPVYYIPLALLHSSLFRCAIGVLKRIQPIGFEQA